MNAPEQPTTIDDLLSRHWDNYTEARAICGLPPIPESYAGPLRRKNRDRAARETAARKVMGQREGVEL